PLFLSLLRPVPYSLPFLFFSHAPPPTATYTLPYTTLFRSDREQGRVVQDGEGRLVDAVGDLRAPGPQPLQQRVVDVVGGGRCGRGARAARDAAAAAALLRPDALEEPRAPPAAAASRGARARERQRQVRAGARDADIEQPALLGDGVGTLGERDRQQPLAHADEEHRVPLQPLRGVQGGER